MAVQPTSKEKGQSLIELALSFLVLLLMVCGIIDLGSMFYTSISLRDTAQEGVIYGATNPLDTAGIINRIKQSATFPINASQITYINPTCGGNSCVQTNTFSCQGQTISVTVNYAYHLITPLIPALVGETVPLSASVTGTILQSTDTITYLKTIGQNCP